MNEKPSKIPNREQDVKMHGVREFGRFSNIQSPSFKIDLLSASIYGDATIKIDEIPPLKDLTW